MYIFLSLIVCYNRNNMRLKYWANYMKLVSASDELTIFYNNNKFDQIAKLQNVKLKEECNYISDEKEKHDCIWYVKKQLSLAITGVFSFSTWQPIDYCQVSTPKLEDIVIYHRGQNGSGENHIGIYEGENFVRSKFGYGHVYSHPIDLVPDDYGRHVSFFTKQRDKSLGNYATIENMEIWLITYGAINSIKVYFPSIFPKNSRIEICKAIDKNPDFLFRLYSCHYDHEIKEDSYCYIYRVLNNFLDDFKNRQILQNMWHNFKS